MSQHSGRFVLLVLLGLMAISIENHPFAQGQAGAQGKNRHEGARREMDEEAGDDRRMSGMGRTARLAATGRLKKADERTPEERLEEVRIKGGSGTGPAGGQAETSLAVDSTGQHIVVGTNDTRGFSSNPVSVSGFAYSDNGGATFVDGGQLPVTVTTSTIGTTTYPQVFGDPEVKYLGGGTFLYFSIMVKKIGTSGTAQTMGVHRSTDYGHTWQGPFEIPAATNPHGTFSGVNAADAADKEFADVDPDTGRVMLSWSNFTSTIFAPGGVEISTTFSDNAATATPPTWSSRTIVANSGVDGQASIPRFAGNGSTNAYVAWRRYPSGTTQNVGFARSVNNGASFSAPINLTANFFTMDHVLGNDRNGTAPALAVDTSTGPRQGNIYVTYSNNDNHDGADITFQRSTDQGVNFSAPMKINSRPGSDRAQWFPWVTVDSTSGRVHIFYYDQGIAPDGDLSETIYQFSDDGGGTWSKPMPLSDRPFHAGYGNDTGEPNLGDYNQAVAQGSALFAVWAGTPPMVGFTDGQPTSVNMTVPDTYFAHVLETVARLPVSLGTISFVDSGPAPNGAIDPGEQISFTIPLTNYVTNPLNSGTITGISATLSTTTPGVMVTQPGSMYPAIAPGASAANASLFAITTGGAFVPGTRIELTLNVASAQGSTALPFTQASGSPFAATLISENFNGVAPGSLPAGWSAVHGAGSPARAWTTSSLSLGSPVTAISNAAFHTNANDGSPSHSRIERLFSPSFVVPATAEYVTIDFDVAYNTEDEPVFNIQTWDGMLLRIADQTPGRLARSVAVEAFAEEFLTGTAHFYPKHLSRQNDPNYLTDLSAWGGDSAGYRHVHLKLPGMEGSTAQLRFEFTQDSLGICSDVRPGHRCGVLVDNVVVQSVRSTTPTSTSLNSSANPALVGQPVQFTATVTTSAGFFATDGSVTFKEGATTLAGPLMLAGGQASFTTSSLSTGSHVIVAQYVSSSGLFGNSSGSVTEVIGTPTTVSLSSSSLTFPKQRVGTVSVPPQVISLTNTGGNPLVFSSFNGAPPTPTFSVAPGDFQGTTTCPLTPAGLPAGQSCEFSFSFSPSAAGPRNAAFAIADNSFSSPHNISLSGTGFIVDEPTVVQSLANAGTRLRLLQNPDGGWFFVAPTNVCQGGPGVSCPNTFGVTGLGLLAAYVRTNDPLMLTALHATGNALVARYNAALLQTPPTRPINQDIEFLSTLGQLTGNTLYTTTAQSWFQVVVDLYPDPEIRIQEIILSRQGQLRQSLVAWDAASFIRAAKAAGNATYALAIATSVRNHEPEWKVIDPSMNTPTNPSGYSLTIKGEGSLLWAIHDLPGFDAQISEYTSFLNSHQDPGGSWDNGNSQTTAYVMVGMGAVGGSDVALQNAAAFYLANQLPNGGWPGSMNPEDNEPENVEVDAEIARAMATIFNTPAGSGILVAPSQLARVTFGSVTSPGRTRVDAKALPPGTRIRGGFQIFNGLTYEVVTSAAFRGSTSVCFSVPWLDDAATFATLRILHNEGGVMVDRTIMRGALAPNFATRQLCASVSSLSGSSAYFAIASKAASHGHGGGHDKDKDKKD